MFVRQPTTREPWSWCSSTIWFVHLQQLDAKSSTRNLEPAHFCFPLSIILSLKKPRTFQIVKLTMKQTMDYMLSQKMKLNAQYVNAHLLMKLSWSGVLKQIMLKLPAVVCNMPFDAVFYYWMIRTLCYWLQVHTLINITKESFQWKK